MQRWSLVKQQFVIYNQIGLSDGPGRPRRFRPGVGEAAGRFTIPPVLIEEVLILLGLRRPSSPFTAPPDAGEVFRQLLDICVDLLKRYKKGFTVCIS